MRERGRRQVHILRLGRQRAVLGVSALFGALALICLFLLLGPRPGEQGGLRGSKPDSSSASGALNSGIATPSSEGTSARTKALRNRADVQLQDPRGSRAGVTGIVVDETGSPIARAQVTIASRPSADSDRMIGRLFPAPLPLAETETDARGRFRLPADDDHSFELLVRHEQYVQESRSGVYGGSDVSITLRDGLVVQGLVVMRDNQGAVPGASVRCWNIESGLQEFLVVSGADGRFESTRVAPGDLRIEVLTEAGKAPWLKLLLDGSSPTPQVRIEVDRGSPVLGRVVSAETGEGISGARVSDVWTFRRTAITDGQGYYSFPGYTRSAGSKLHAVATGFGQSASKLKPALNGEPLIANFSLMKAREAIGFVVDAGGNPVVGANVVAVSYGADVDRAIGETDSDGRFHLQGLRPDRRHTLVVRTVAQESAVLAFPPDEFDSSRIDLGVIALSPISAVRGVVRDEDARPQEGALVVLAGTGFARWRFWEAQGVPPMEDWILDTVVAERQTRSNARGEFLFPGVQPGSYRAQVRNVDQLVLSEAKFEHPGDRAPIELELSQSTGLELSGIVVNALGDGIGGVQLLVIAAGGIETAPSFRTVSDAAGHFHFSGITNDVVNVEARPASRSGQSAYVASSMRGVECGSDPITLVLRSSGQVSGQVDGPSMDGELDTSVVVVCARDKDGLVLSSQGVRVPGDFVLLVPAEESVTLEVWPDGSANEVERSSGVYSPIPGYRCLVRRDSVGPGSAGIQLRWGP